MPAKVLPTDSYTGGPRFKPWLVHIENQQLRKKIQVADFSFFENNAKTIGLSSAPFSATICNLVRLLKQMQVERNHVMLKRSLFYSIQVV